tara:strand:+ start:323 stop:703 length:381 start_codon:yes stop_codon:yes gene_type:complete
MKTILNRIFINDISEIIYNFLIYDYVNGILIGKINLIELMMLKINNTWNTDKNIYNLNIIEFRQIYTMINQIYNNFIIKNYYNFDKEFIIVLKNYSKVIEENNIHEKYPFIKEEINKKISTLKNYI